MLSNEILPNQEGNNNRNKVADDEIKEHNITAQGYPHYNIPWNEWMMCTISEAQERKSCHELSIFECMSNEIGDPIRNMPDPFRCVKKYRRSAAGGGAIRRDLHQRTLDEIEITILYILGGVFTRQRPPHRHHHLYVKAQENLQEVNLLNDTNPIMEHTHSLCNTIKFVDDRIRAVQVDLTTLLGNHEFDAINNYYRIRRLQAMIIRYHLLSQYLLCGRTKKQLDFEWTFALTALRTSLSAYLETWRDQPCIIENVEKEIQEQDEVLSYVALLHIAAVVRCREMAVELIPQSSDRPYGIFLDEGNGINALLSFFRKYVPHQANIKKYPKFCWALKLSMSIEEGNFILALRMLTHDNNDDCELQESLYSIYHDDFEPLACLGLPLSTNLRWKIIARCILAQVLPFIYLVSLRQYNKAFMKGEKMSINDIGKLFCDTSSSVFPFCQAIGLPSSTINESEFFISMKTAEISLRSLIAVEFLKAPCRTNFLDPFVFGAMNRKWLQPNPVVGLNHLEMDASKTIDTLRDWGHFHVRIDENGIRIPPSSTLWELIRWYI